MGRKFWGRIGCAVLLLSVLLGLCSCGGSVSDYREGSFRAEVRFSWELGEAVAWVTVRQGAIETEFTSPDGLSGVRVIEDGEGIRLMGEDISLSGELSERLASFGRLVCPMGERRLLCSMEREGRRVICGEFDGGIEVWLMESGEPVCLISRELRADILQFAPIT